MSSPENLSTSEPPLARPGLKPGCFLGVSLACLGAVSGAFVGKYATQAWLKSLESPESDGDPCTDASESLESQADPVGILCAQGFELPLNEEKIIPPQGAVTCGVAKLDSEGEMEGHLAAFGGKLHGGGSQGCTVSPEFAIFHRSFTHFLTGKDSALAFCVPHENGEVETLLYPLDVSDLSEVPPDKRDRVFRISESPFRQPIHSDQGDTLAFVDKHGHPFLLAGVPRSEDGSQIIVSAYFWDDLSALVEAYGEENIFVSNHNGIHDLATDGSITYRDDTAILAESINVGEFWSGTTNRLVDPNP